MRSLRRRLLIAVLCALAASHIFSAADGEDPANEPRQTIVRDVPYFQREGGEARLTSLDVYAPRDGKDLPVVVWIHGGGWRIGDKRAVQLKPRAFNERGFVLVSINYRLYPDAVYAEQAGDVARAVRWVVDHAGEHGGSPQRIYLLGHSAGAHLAALTAINERYLKAEKLPTEAMPVGKARIAREGRDMTIVAYSAMVHEALAAAEELATEGWQIEVVDLRSVKPLDTDTVVASVARTGRLLCVGEAWPWGGVTAEVIARVVSEGLGLLDAPPQRLNAKDTPVPYHPNLWAAHRPTARAIAEASRKLLNQ